MPSADFIRNAKANDVTASQQLEKTVSYNPGHLGGFSVIFEDEQPHIGPGAADVKGRKVLRRESVALAACEWRVPKVNSYQYYLYIDLNGTLYVDNQPPTIADGFVGAYHPSLLARHIATFYVNNVGRYMSYTVSTFILIGYSGNGTPYAPNEGDNRQYLDGDETRYEEYTNGAWTSLNGIRIGGSDDNGVFRAFMNCRGVANPLADDVSQEFFPSTDFKVISYDSDFDTHDEESPNAQSNNTRVTTWQKFGTHSFYALVSGAAYIQYSDTSGNGIISTASIGTWFNIDSLPTVDGSYTLMYSYCFTESSIIETDGEIYCIVEIVTSDTGTTHKLRLRFEELDLTATEIQSASIEYTLTGAPGEIFLGAQVLDDDMIYFIVNDTIYSTGISAISLTADVDSKRAQFYAYNTHNGLNVYVDDSLYTYIDSTVSDLFVQHYNHNQPWNPDYSAKDLVLLAADGGNVRTNSGVVFRPTGEITMWGSSTAPTGWLLCDGTAYSRTTYSDLYAIIGTTYGTGDGSTTFNLPDFVGAAPAGAGTSTGYTTNETLTLGTKHNDQFETHNHKIDSGQGSHNHSYGENLLAYSLPAGSTFSSGSDYGRTADGSTSSATLPAMYTNSVSAGNDQTTTHGKLVGVNFIIKT